MTAEACVVASCAAYLLFARDVGSPGSARSIAAMRRISMVPSPSRRHPSCCAMSLSFKRTCLSYHLLPDLLGRSRVGRAQFGLTRGFPCADDHARRRADRATELLFENRLHAHEELLEVVVVVELLAGDGIVVGLEDRVDVRVAVEQDVEREVARIADRRHRWRRDRQARLESLDEIALEARVDAGVPRQLTVVILARVKWLVRVLDVVGRDGRKERDVRGRVRRLPRESFERTPQVAEHLGFAPWPVADAIHRALAELLESLVALARQPCERIGSELRHTEVHEVIRIVVPAGTAPDVRIDRANDDLVFEALEVRLQRRRQQLDRASHDQAMTGESPGDRGTRREQHDRERRCGEGLLSHDCYINWTWITSRTRSLPRRSAAPLSDVPAAAQRLR